MIKKTHIMYEANLTHGRLEKYLNILLTDNFLRKKTAGRETYYEITKQGYKYLAEIRKLEKISEAFGIPI